MKKFLVMLLLVVFVFANTGIIIAQEDSSEGAVAEEMVEGAEDTAEESEAAEADSTEEARRSENHDADRL